MATVERFEELDCWQTARELSRRIYRYSARGDFSKDFGLRDQMRRSAVSVMSNIAEGFESRTRPMFLEFLGRAKGSAGELRAQLYIALDAGYVPESEFDEMRDLAEKISAQLSRLSAYLRSAPTGENVGEDLPPYNLPTFNV
jgi:four helix bundle protein